MDKSALADAAKSMRYSVKSWTEHKFFENIPYGQHSDSAPDILLPGEFQPRPLTGSDWEVKHQLGKLFDQCIQQVSHLEAKRNQHIQELLGLHEPMLIELEVLRRELEETQRRLSVAQLGHRAVSREAERAKRKLFATARDCIQSQVTLAAQEYEVAQSVITLVSKPVVYP